MVGQRAADRGQEEDGGLADEAGQAEQERRVGQPIDEPRLRHGLQPRPDQRDGLSAEVEAEVAVMEGAKDRWRHAANLALETDVPSIPLPTAC